MRDGIETLAIGAALGFAGRATLHALDAAMYRALPDYRSDAHNLRGFMPWETTALSRFPPAGRIVVIGAGGGRELIALARAGYEAHGFECNAALRGVAERLLPHASGRASLRALPRDSPPPTDRVYDAAIVGWSAYMLIVGRAARVRFLTGLRRVLPAGAPVLLSFFTRDESDARLRRIASYANACRRLLGRPAVEPGDDLAPTFVHRFTCGEIDTELAAAGFRLEHFQPQGDGPEDSGWAVARAAPDHDFNEPGKATE